MEHTITTNKYGGIDFEYVDIMNISYDDFLIFLDVLIKKCNESKYIVYAKKNVRNIMKKINVFSKCKIDGEKYYNIIKDCIKNNIKNYDILTKSSTARLMIYIICNVCNIKHKTLCETHKEIISCKDYGGTGYGDYCIGCEKIFELWNNNSRKEIGLDYDDKFMSFEVPMTIKIGVKINF